MGTVILLPIILLPYHEWGNLSKTQWVIFSVILVLHTGYAVRREWPESGTIRQIKLGNLEKLQNLHTMVHVAVGTSISRYRKAHHMPPLEIEMRSILLILVHVSAGFKKRLCVAHSTKGVPDRADFSTWSKSEGFCGACWKRGLPICWKPGETPDNWDGLSDEQRSIRNSRSGICVPILSNKMRVKGVLYMDFDQNIVDTGLHEKRPAAVLMKLATMLFAGEFPEVCVVGRP